MPLASGFWWLVLIYSCSVIGWSLIEPTRKSLIASVGNPQTTARNFGLAETAFGLGAVLGPLIGGYLYDNVSHASPFIFNGVLVLGLAVFSSWLLRTPVRVPPG